MKNILKYIGLIVTFIGLGSCDKGFIEVNTNPIAILSVDPSYLFNEAQRLLAHRTVDYQANIVQQIQTLQPGSLAGGNYNKDFDIQTIYCYNDYYTGPVKNLIDVINLTKDNPDRSNLYNMARIVKAYVFEVLVDTYGDIPYFDAGKAYLSSVYLPKYDPAADVYNDIIKELTEATQALDGTKKIETSELFYKGNITQWKRLGNSLLLRTAMRLSKVDPTKAQQTLGIALDPAKGGVIESNTDNAKIAYNTTFNNTYTARFHAAERGNYYLGSSFVDYLRNTNDPRLIQISVKYQYPANPIASVGTKNTTPAVQIGMPYGYDAGTIATAPGYPGAIGGGYGYSQPNRETLTALEAPGFIMTASQTLLLKAEAAQRGWITGVVADLYNAGVRANMNQFAQYTSAATIPTASQDAYLTANPFDPSKALEQINTQYWISSYINWDEAWANFRRSGYPILIPNPYPQADPDVKGGFIRRLSYPDREWSVNGVNVQEAVDRQGPDNLSTRIFWDKP